MISGHGPNPTFFNKKNKDWTSRTLANPPLHPPPHPTTSDNISFLPYPHSHSPFKVGVICISPLFIKED